jgi:acetoin utilization deacetylase AcuC-like enzyme
MPIKVFYTDKQVADQGDQGFSAIKSPSAMKPKQIAAALENFQGIEFIAPNPISVNDLYRCHSKKYVDDILSLQASNGFGNKSPEIAQALMYTNGAMLDAARAATANSPTCALVSGFHHAGYDRWEGLGYFCTFNGLMATAFAILNEGNIDNVTIIDCDYHWGNGTDDILLHSKNNSAIKHITFGNQFYLPRQASEYLEYLSPGNYVERSLIANKCGLILYQAGADVHINDPYGGLFTTEEIATRDRLMFQMAKKLQIPIAWNLAGGYQIDKDGKIDEVIKIHLNTFIECQKVYGESRE